MTYIQWKDMPDFLLVFGCQHIWIGALDFFQRSCHHIMPISYKASQLLHGTIPRRAYILIRELEVAVPKGFCTWNKYLFRIAVNIALIPKTGKRKKHMIDNHRGIFLIHKYKSLLMRMLLNDKHPIIDEHMTESNIGGRKNRGIRDHLFVVNVVIFEHCKSKTNPISFQIMDFKSCFDSLWELEVINDLFEAGVTDDKLVVIHKLNETNHIRVKTPAGLSSVKTVENVVGQGDPWGTTECGVMVDGFGRDSLKEELEPYMYKGTVPVPLLGMVDDIFIISESGHKTSRMNGFINAKTAIKRLQFNPEKCQVMHIGKDIPFHKKPNLVVDGWKMQEVLQISTGNKTIEESHEEGHEVTESSSEKYFGQMLSSDGSNVKNVTNLSNKGRGMVNTIMNILNHMPGGKFHFELAVIFRKAYLISSMLTCSEVWYH